MNNKTIATLNLISAIFFSISSSINFVSFQYGLGIINLSLLIIFIIMFTQKIEFKK